MISVFMNGQWKNGIVTKIYDGQDTGMVNLSSEDLIEVSLINAQFLLVIMGFKALITFKNG